MLVLFADTDSDITKKKAEELGIKLISMPYILNDQEIFPYESWDDYDSHEFYERLRGGLVPKTCGLSTEKYKSYFEPEFRAGNDILYIHFSTAMSGTFNAMSLALEELKEAYPDRNFYEIDTKGITINAYSIVLEIVEKAKSGMNATELVKYGTELAEHTACYFFTDTLKFFKYSGRVTNLAAFMGGMIGIRPIIYMDQNGTMTSLTKVKGRTKALEKIVEYFSELGDDVKNHPVVIGHSDCPELAHQLGDMLTEKFGKDLNIEYVMVNPTAGCHCGPDGLGLTFHSIHK